MAWFMAALPYISTIGSTVMSVNSSNQAARRAEDTAEVNAVNALNIANYNADKYAQEAKGEQAAAQLRGQEARRQMRLRKSRVLALSAASGGGAMDMDVVNTIAGFEEEADFAYRTEMYGGDEAARTLTERSDAGIWEAKNTSSILKYEGASKALAHRNQATASIMGGASSLAGKYGAYKDGGVANA